VLAVATAGLAIRYAVYLLWFDDAEIDRYLEHLCVWSCEWYGSIAQNGYDLAPRAGRLGVRANWAYFPLFPLSVAALKTVTGLPLLVAGFILSNAYVVVASVAARPLFDNARAYWLFVVTMLAGPFSFLFSTLYSEGLFILLTVLVLVALKRSNYVLAGVFGALLSATRPTGVLIVFAILAQVIIDHRRASGTWRGLVPRILADPKVMLAFFVAPLGLFAYMAYLYVHVGDALAFSHIQSGWGRAIDSPFTHLGDVFERDLTDHRAYMYYFWAWAAIIGYALSVLLVLRRQAPAGLFCALCITVSLVTGIGSMVRFIAGLAPLGIVLADVAGKWRVTTAALAIVAVVAGMALTLGRFNGSILVM
jgi:hypothetical protein